MPDSAPARQPRTRLLAVAAAATALAAVSAAGGYRLGAGDDGLDYATDYADHPPLHVVGYPSTGSLAITPRVVWRLAEGSADGLAGLATSDGSSAEARSTAANWVTAFGEGAQGAVTADFYDEGSVRQSVVLYFHDTGQMKQLRIRLDGLAVADGWKVLLREPDPEGATAPPAWARPPPAAATRSADAPSRRTPPVT
ncbi:hypothetical protein ACH4E7_24545 [Kitasatospora sp. NPDC018058]|uniref:hypothetical protein n=1 Tax=Kitasatospora sp. NPDC018058 TaxID=3364025 RepID=UPI0037C024A8